MKNARITGAPTLHKAVGPITVTVLGLFAMGAVQAATLACGAPLRVSTTAASGWTSDAKYVTDPGGNPMATVLDKRWTGLGTYFDPTGVTHGTGAGTLAGQPLQGHWLSFGTGGDGDPVVNVTGDTANGAWTAGRVAFIRTEPITVASDVDLASIKIVGTGGADFDGRLLVKPTTLPGGVSNTTNWFKSTAMINGWTSPQAINMDDGNLGFYYGDNTIAISLDGDGTTATWPTGMMLDMEITADCLTPPPPPPTAALICPAGNTAGQTVRVGPFTTNARDWKWTWRTNAAGTALENVEQPLFDDYSWAGAYVKPSSLPAGQETNARWISPGTTNPAASDVPGLPYPAASGQAKAGYHASVFVMNQPINVGNNVDLASIKLDGRFAFDDYGNSVFVQPAGGAPVFDNASLYLPNGYGSFQATTTPAIPGFTRGQNTIGLMLDGLQATNDCANGVCAMAAMADFYVTAACTGEPPVATDQTITFPAQTSPRRIADGAFPLNPVATASSTLPVTYTSLTPAVCTVSGTTITPVAVGECQIAADQGGGTVGSTIYNAAARVVQSVTLQTAPVVSPATPVPTLGAAGLALLGLLSAGLGGLALRRRQRI